MSTLKGVTTLILLAVHSTAWCTPLYAIGIIRLLIPNQRARDALAIPMNRIVEGWVATNRMVFRIMGINRTRVSWSLDSPLSRHDWYVVVSNHQTWADILILQDVLLGRVPPLKFFIKRVLVWVPLIGVAMWFLDFPSVRRYSRDEIAANPALRDHDRNAVRAACEHFKRAPSSVLNFLEGTRFTSEKHNAQASPYQNLLTPKVGGIQQVLSALGDRAVCAVDVTIVYPSGAPDFWDYLCGRCEPAIVDIQTRELPAIGSAGEPDVEDASRAKVRGWADDLWAHKDAHIMQLAGRG
jgi:1-acyl-sn-glycerol-3-phosphate acyltransferase